MGTAQTLEIKIVLLDIRQADAATLNDLDTFLRCWRGIPTYGTWLFIGCFRVITQMMDMGLLQSSGYQVKFACGLWLYRDYCARYWGG